jgi:hypothetical protein
MPSARPHCLPLLALAAWSIGAFPPREAKADLIGDWNRQALGAIADAERLAPEASRDLAILYAAIYNSVEGIAGEYTLYTSGGYSGPSGTAAQGASTEAAVAAAAFTVLQGLYPSMTGDFAALYSSQLSGIADGQSKLDGINFGTLVANDLLNWRAVDGSANAGDPNNYTPQFGQPGHWQPVPPAYSSSPDLPGWGGVTTFAIGSTSGFAAPLPGASLADYLSSAQYAADYNEVRELGAATSGTRTTEQLNAAYFWAAGTGTVTTAGMWNQIAETVAASAGLSLQDSARLYAALNLAMADSAIVAWETLYANDLWRPITAIVNGDTDGNAATDQDITWQSLLTDTPNSPAYLSAHSAISAAAAKVLAAFLGDDFTFTAGSDINGDGVIDLTKEFTSFSSAAQEAGMSQIYGGVSFGTSNTEGLATGDLVGDYVLENYFAPVPEPSGALLLVSGALLLTLRRSRHRQTARN